MKNVIRDKKFDLEERTAVFGENVIEFVRKIPKNTITVSLINQLVKISNQYRCQLL